jgi:hypothetical protein
VDSNPAIKNRKNMSEVLDVLFQFNKLFSNHLNDYEMDLKTQTSSTMLRNATSLPSSPPTNFNSWCTSSAAVFLCQEAMHIN